MSRADRLINKKRAKDARINQHSTVVQEQIAEEQDFSDNLVGFVERKNKPLLYELEDGGILTIPCLTAEGHTMTYHDQHYQIVRYKNGLPVEAKRMCDYKFEAAATPEEELSDDRQTLADLTPSTAYLSMKEAHEQQHPPED